MAAKKTSAKKIVAKKKAASAPAKKAETAAPKAPAKVVAATQKVKVTFDLATAMLGLPAGSAEKAPSMPVRTAQLEAERLWAVAKPARAKFVALEDFPADSFDAIPHLIAALGEAETDWQRKRIAKRQKSLGALRKQAEDARQKVMVVGRYRLRKNAAAQLELDRIAEGDGLPDLIQDLLDLADFIGSHMDVMTRDKNITEATPGQLRETAQALNEGEDDSEPALKAREHRNQVFVALDEALGEVRAAAGYLYADDPKRLHPYRSQYEARQRAAQRQAKKAQPKKAPTKKPPSDANDESDD